MIKKSFTLRVLIISFLLLALPLFIDSFLFSQKTYYEEIAAEKRDLKTMTDLRIFTLVAAQPVKHVLLKELIYLFDLNHAVSSGDLGINHELARLVHLSGEYQINILKIESEGLYKIVASSEASFLGSYFTSYRSLDRIAAQGEGAFVRYIYSPERHDYIPILFIAQVIRSLNTGIPIGFVMITSNLEKQLTITLDAATDDVHGAQFAIVNADGVIFAATDKNLEGEYFHTISAQRREEINRTEQLGNRRLANQPIPILLDHNPSYFEFSINNRKQIAYRAEVPQLEIAIIGYTAKEEFFKQARHHFLFIYTLYGVILVLGGAITYWLSLWISRPLKQLTDLMEEVSLGNLGVRFKETSLGFEVNTLGRMFNHTLDVLLENIQKAEDERVKKETYQREISIGRGVQKNLLPNDIFQITGANIAAIYLPAIDVGGDTYGFLTKKTALGEDAVVLSIVDLQSRGISSCMYSLSARSLFRAYALLSDDVGAILSRSNHDFFKDTDGKRIALKIFMGMYHVQSKRLSYYSCGSVPAFIKKSNGELIQLAHSEIEFGVQDSLTSYVTNEITLNSGDTLFLYTHGLISLSNEKQEIYSEKRLQFLLQTKEYRSAQEVIDCITEDLDAFTDTIQQDKETIIVVLRVD